MSGQTCRTGGPAASCAVTVKNLSIEYAQNGREVLAVRGVSFGIAPGETLCVVGESGSGKTSLALAIPALLPASARVTGDVEVARSSVYSMNPKSLRRLRQCRISFIFQDAVGSLVPHVSVGKQLVQVVGYRSGERSRNEVLARVDALLEQVGLPALNALKHALPRELSGGMCQRVMIAMALSVQPILLIADEPTSALDAVTQELILALLRRLQLDHGFAMLCVTHDLRIARRLSTHVGVMKAGELVELDTANAFFSGPRHSYSCQLMEAAARLSIDSHLSSENI
jgi:microcin C transport system ATP-binding protein